MTNQLYVFRAHGSHVPVVCMYSTNSFVCDISDRLQPNLRFWRLGTADIIYDLSTKGTEKGFSIPFSPGAIILATLDKARAENGSKTARLFLVT